MKLTRLNSYRLTILSVVAAAMSMLIMSSFAVVVSALDAGETDADGESILISPVDKRYTLRPGEVKTDSVRVVNDGTTPLRFVVYTRPYSVNDEQYTPDFTSNPKNADVYRWMRFEKTAYELKAGETADVPYTIQVPENASPGGHYGVLFAETQTQESDTGNAVLRKKRVGSIMYVTVDGDVRLGGSRSEISVPFFQTQAPISGTQTIKNTGNTDFQVTSTFSVADLFGDTKYTNTAVNPVLPETSRTIRSEWREDARWFGLYKVTLQTNFVDQSYNSTHYVLLAPIWMYVTLVGLIIARVAYGYSRKKKR